MPPQAVLYAGRQAGRHSTRKDTCSQERVGAGRWRLALLLLSQQLLRPQSQRPAAAACCHRAAAAVAAAAACCCRAQLTANARLTSRQSQPLGSALLLWKHVKVVTNSWPHGPAFRSSTQGHASASAIRRSTCAAAEQRRRPAATSQQHRVRHGASQHSIWAWKAPARAARPGRRCMRRSSKLAATMQLPVRTSSSSASPALPRTHLSTGPLHMLLPWARWQPGRASESTQLQTPQHTPDSCATCSCRQ